MSSVAASDKFPWQVFRGPAALFTAYVVQHNVAHTTDKSQWWLPVIFIGVAALTTVFEGIYDEALPGGLLGPANMSNFTCMLVALGVPIAALVGGVLRGGWHWWAGALVVLLLNAIIYFGFRQRGLSATLVFVCLLGLAIS